MMSREQKYTLVLGDVMLDEYVYGTVDRLSPESGCPVLLYGRCENQLGGAANVARQISRLGRQVRIAALTGRDHAGATIRELLQQEHIDSSLLFHHDMQTTVKRRYVNQMNRQLMREDIEQHAAFTEEEARQVLCSIRSQEVECLVISDYNKGVISTTFCQQVIAAAATQGIEVIVDIKEPCVEKYVGATIVKGNAAEIARLSDDHPQLLRLLKASLLVVTQGSKGMIGLDSKGQTYCLPADSRTVYDVTGAGDTVTAWLAVTGLMGYGYADRLHFANKAADLKVQRAGTSFVSLHEVLPKIVFTNGCFDVLHAGHVDMLQKARQKGDLLVVGLNSDASVRRLKGPSRPVNNQEQRARVLSALECVDRVVLFEEDTPQRLIETIRPSVLVKGGDYRRDEIVGADFVESYGGEVCTIPIVYNVSTSKILNN